MSGGEPSSIKQFTRCAARKPSPSSSHGPRAGEAFETGVYGLILRRVRTIFHRNSNGKLRLFPQCTLTRGW